MSQDGETCTIKAFERNHLSDYLYIRWYFTHNTSTYTLSYFSTLSRVRNNAMLSILSKTLYNFVLHTCSYTNRNFNIAYIHIQLLAAKKHAQCAFNQLVNRANNT